MRTQRGLLSRKNARSEEGQIDLLGSIQVRDWHEDDIKDGSQKAKQATRRRQQLSNLPKDTLRLCDSYCPLMDGYDNPCETAIIEIRGCLGLLNSQLEVFHSVVVVPPPTPKNPRPRNDGLLQVHVLVYSRIQIWTFQLQISTSHERPIAIWMFQCRAVFGAQIVWCCADRGWHVERLCHRVEEAHLQVWGRSSLHARRIRVGHRLKPVHLPHIEVGLQVCAVDDECVVSSRKRMLLSSQYLEIMVHCSTTKEFFEPCILYDIVWVNNDDVRHAPELLTHREHLGFSSRAMPRFVNIHTTSYENHEQIGPNQSRR